MRFCSLGSGSAGNALAVGAADTGYVLLDCGFGLREIEQRLSDKQLTPQDLRAIAITHEHGDHIGSAYAMAAKYALPLVMSHGTARAAQHLAVRPSYAQVHTQIIHDGEMLLSYAGLAITAFSVPHDSAEPLQFTFTKGRHKLGVLTDLGMSTAHVLAALQGCDSLVLECNHDTELLANGVYPTSLKQRVGGNYGHLSNAAAAQILCSLNHSGLRHVVCAHLSAQNNRPDLAQAALALVLGSVADDVLYATQENGLDWRDV
jgi:phosphoribosyl 1,2-cyclic phosphodiesterase